MACMFGSGMSSNEQMLHWAHAVDDCTTARNLQPRGDFENAYVPFGEQPLVKPKNLVPWGAKGWMTKRGKRRFLQHLNLESDESKGREPAARKQTIADEEWIMSFSDCRLSI